LWRFACLFALFVAIAGGTAAAAAARPQVAALQVALRAHGFYLGSIDAVYGPATARGLRRFQRRAGLHVDGRIGPATRLALGPLGRPGLGRRTLRRGALGWDVSVTQFLLVRGGSVLPVNGYFGARTERALKRFQRAHRLTVDGVAGRRTLAALLVRRSKQVARVASSRAGIGRVRALIDFWANHYGVDPALVHALAWMESGYQSNLTSSVGAWGVMQILPSTWSYVETVLVGGKVPRTVSGNIRVGVVLIRQLLGEFAGERRAALAAWYQGPSSLRRRGPYRMTRLFVADVLALQQRFT
jgi:peptidoglycan hydrolase-like protein with peptidoglycan-binding domain